MTFHFIGLFLSLLAYYFRVITDCLVVHKAVVHEVHKVGTRAGVLNLGASADLSHQYKAIIGHFRIAQPALKRRVKDPNE